MRHRKKFRRLSRFASSRKALLKNMAIALLREEKIITTLAKAKEVRPIIDKLINLGKQNDLTSKRFAFKVVQDRTMVEKLFKDIAPRFKDRNSGYTRIVHYRPRRGDGALLAILELTVQKPKEKKKLAPQRGKKAVPEVKEKEERLEKVIAEPEAEVKKEVLPEEKTAPPVKEEREEIKQEEKPVPPPKREKPKSFLEGIRGLFKRKKDRQE
ncbi:MAG: 50S ribosomal protein L17 [Candidatus Omnitrophica bacterium]|nr:50S ribosomal protein L17 [Candidatus Omnitrophota bacterium]MCM8798067.1 50S ribosomal protein L17 [Candidatus Omnitrophota bacterium]